MKLLVSVSILMIAALFSSCRKGSLKGEGSIVSETRTLASFTEFESSGDFDIEVYPGDENKAVVSGYQNLVPAFETRVSNGKLKLQFERKYINVRNNNIRVTLYVKQLNNAALNGSGNILLHPGIVSDDLTAEINGSGDINIETNTFERAYYKINGSGKINARPCTVQHATTRISGSGDINLTAEQSLRVKISGSGSVNYWGSPEVVETDIDGSGKVNKR